ncbi:hypothetical protein BC834DRAFT_974885 [Gloeopeniophorella convolvens]|nr:hypothetical protein BC834DRAFT_974885 [Gloeopeniophorella convolvens]
MLNPLVSLFALLTLSAVPSILGAHVGRSDGAMLQRSPAEERATRRQDVNSGFVQLQFSPAGASAPLIEYMANGFFRMQFLEEAFALTVALPDCLGNTFVCEMQNLLSNIYQQGALVGSKTQIALGPGSANAAPIVPLDEGDGPSNVWLLNSATGELTVQWTNPDGSISHPIIAGDGSTDNLYFVGDLDAWNAALAGSEGAGNAVPFTAFLVPATF